MNRLLLTKAMKKHLTFAILAMFFISGQVSARITPSVDGRSVTTSNNAAVVVKDTKLRTDRLKTRNTTDSHESGEIRKSNMRKADAADICLNLQGGWIFNAFNFFTENLETYTYEITAADGHDDMVSISGWSGWTDAYTNFTVNAECIVDNDNNVLLYIPYGQTMGTIYVGYELCDIIFLGLEDYYIIEEGGCYANVSDDFNTIEFDGKTTLVYYALSHVNGYIGAIDITTPTNMTKSTTNTTYDGLKYKISLASNEATCRGPVSPSTMNAKIVIPEYIEYGGKQCPVTSIEDWAFLDCINLTEVEIPGSVKNLGIEIFFNCSNLTKVKLPESLDTIPFQMFAMCKSLADISIPKSVNAIGGLAFANCESLLEVTIPKTVTVIAEYSPFWGCTSLKSINVENDNPSYCSVDGVLFSKDKTKLIQCLPCFKGSYVIPNTVRKICYGAFGTCKELTSIEIPGSTTLISNYAFAYCYNLTSITIPDSVEHIGENAFEGCDKIQTVTLPKNITSIQFHTFYNCTSLKEIDIPDLVTDIQTDAFYNCTELTAITLGQSVKYIWDASFANCGNIKIVNCKASTPPSCEGDVQTGRGPFQNVNLSAATLHVPQGTKGAYTAANVWQDFGTIIDDLPATEGIDDVLGDNACDVIDVYNLQGVRVARGIIQSDIETLPSGLYIAGGKKIIVK